MGRIVPLLSGRDSHGTAASLPDRTREPTGSTMARTGRVDGGPSVGPRQGLGGQ